MRRRETLLTPAPTPTPTTIRGPSGHGAAGNGAARRSDDACRELAALSSALETRSITPYERWLKPVLDRVLAAMLIVVLVPVLVLIALTVLVAMGRPVLFRQTRVGLHGREFAMLKFRTMRPDRRVTSAPYRGCDRRRTHKSAEDPRHTAVGRFMRKFSLDELPQLFNVLLGQMSMVGPRPELTEIANGYAPWQCSRYLVKPGVTGLWQTTERGMGLPLHECIDRDLEYISRLSFRQDVGIILRTPVALLRTKGVV